jgi:3-oxoacyl-[acyl-carrier protein] reductase/7-alpha-hydroxysteroid dehydrogenase
MLYCYYYTVNISANGGTNMNLLNGKSAMVTGGTRGIGYAIVKKFLENGASVALCGSRKETVDKALEQLKAENPEYNVIGLCPDLSSPDEIAEAVATVKNTFGSLDIMVNNAGVSARDSIYDYNPDDFARTMELNVNAVFNCSQAAARVMKPQGGGVILNTSSMVSIYGQPSGSAYPASKFAVNGLTKSLARELGKDNIRVNAVAPGVTRTDMVAALPEAVIKPIIAGIPLGRVGEPEDVANAFLYLASDMASYVTGAVLSVDGAART